MGLGRLTEAGRKDGEPKRQDADNAKRTPNASGAGCPLGRQTLKMVG
jgi:hypothetical protein